MSTTTIRLDPQLRERINQAAERAGVTPHAFMHEAVAQRVELAELEQDFRQVAEDRWQLIQQTGETVHWAEAQDYLKARVQGRAARRPVPRKPA